MHAGAQGDAEFLGSGRDGEGGEDGSDDQDANEHEGLLTALPARLSTLVFARKTTIDPRGAAH
jgi:hypothetical protein